MSRRSGQNGYVEKRGNAYYVRFWIDVIGQEKRKLACARICPVSGPGKMNASERKRRAKEIIAESGADSAEHFNRVVAVNRSVTFREQSERWLAAMRTRKRKPVKPATLHNWQCSLTKWVNPHLGDVPLSDVNNLALRNFVSMLVDAGLSANSVRIHVQAVKMVVGSAITDAGEQMYPRKWNHAFIDMPEIKNLRTPTLIAEQISIILPRAEGHFRLLYALLGGAGLRIGEALGLEIDKHISEDCRTLTIEQSVWHGAKQTPKTQNAYRQVDLHPALASLLKECLGDRKSGFLFVGRGGRPIASQSSILKRSLHPILDAAGIPRCGFHAFRRFRNTYLRNYTSCPAGLRTFWLAWNGKVDMSDHYDKIREDEAFRREVAESIGLGFVIPVTEPAVVRIDTKTEAAVQAA